MKKQFVIVGITLVLICVGFAGCISSEEITAEEIKANFLQAIEEVTSYKYSEDVTGTSTTINESGTNITETVATQNGEVDIANKKLKQDNAGTTTGLSYERHWIVYIVDNILYSGSETDGNMTWTSTDTSYLNASMMWAAYSALGTMSLYLEGVLENSTIERLDDEMVEGVDCYVLYLTAFQNISGGGSDMFPISGNASYEYELNYWIAKDTYFLIKVQFNSTSDMSGLYAFGEADRMIIVAEMDIVFYDYNVPVIIELPPEVIEGSDGEHTDTTPIMTFIATDQEDINTLTVNTIDPSNVNWSDIELQVNGTAQDHGMSGIVTEGDIIDISNIAGTGEYTINIRHMPTNTLIASFDFI